MHHHRQVRFLSTFKLANALVQEKLNGKPGHLANRLIETGNDSYRFKDSTINTREED